MKEYHPFIVFPSPNEVRKLFFGRSLTPACSDQFALALHDHDLLYEHGQWRAKINEAAEER